MSPRRDWGGYERELAEEARAESIRDQREQPTAAEVEDANRRAERSYDAQFYGDTPRPSLGLPLMLRPPAEPAAPRERLDPAAERRRRIANGDPHLRKALAAMFWKGDQ